MLKIRFCAQHSFRFDSNSSPYLKSVLCVAVCDIKGGSSSSLNKAQVFSAHCLISFCVWRIPYLFWGAGIVGADGIPVELFQILKDDAVKANLENSAVATGLEKIRFHSNPKERQCQRMLKLPHNCSPLTC